jgi:uncharacterized membrane protein (DUF2068 family)
VPLEAYEAIRRAGVNRVLVLLVNVAIVVYPVLGRRAESRWTAA